MHTKPIFLILGSPGIRRPQSGPATHEVVCASSLNAGVADVSRKNVRVEMQQLASLSSVSLFEVKIGQIHCAAGQDVDRENIPPLAEANLEEIRS